MTNTVSRRIDKLESHLGVTGKPGLLYVASPAAWRHPLDVDTCVNILPECGFVPTGPSVNMVNLLFLPEGLGAGELERFLREHGGELKDLGIQGDA